MAESRHWRFTVVGGDENGTDAVFPSDHPVIIGRSHKPKVDFRVPEADVSRRHLKLLVEDGIAKVRNLSQFPASLNGGEIAPGDVVPVRDGECISLGQSVRIRFDETPGDPSPETFSEMVSGATEETAVPDLSRQTCAGSPTVADSPTEAIEETGATRLPSGLEETGETHLPSDVGMTSATRIPADMEETIAFDGDAASQASVTGVDVTPVLDPQVIQHIKAGLERKRKLRRVFVSLCLVFMAVAMVGLWFLSRTDKEIEEMSYPENSQGRPDIARYTLVDASGDPLLTVDYPRDPNMSVTASPDSNGVSVVSSFGRDRDVPFFMQLEVARHPDELKLSLMDSVRAWFARAEGSGEGFVFDDRMKNELNPKFFEDAYPGSCQKKSLYGVQFVEFDYKRSWPDGKLWHGVAIYFRTGDAVYVYRREIPESCWSRGGYRFRIDSNIAVYATFTDSYWQSPGADALPQGKAASERMASIRNSLVRERASDWRFVRGEIDAVLAGCWRTDPKTRGMAMTCLRQYREILKTFYWGKYNAYQNAKDNRDEKKMRRLRMDVQMVFGDPSERYYDLVNGGEVW